MKPLILIVEDEPGIADTLQYALRTEGFEPVWCASAEAAIAAVAQQAPSLVILDVGLPDMSGFELFKRLRAQVDVPVVFLTARGDEIDRVVGLELGADDYVAKPFSPRELVARVRSVLRRSRQGAPRRRPRPHPSLRECSRSTTASGRSASTAARSSCRATSSACCARWCGGRATCTRATRCSSWCGTAAATASIAPSMRT